MSASLVRALQFVGWPHPETSVKNERDVNCGTGGGGGGGKDGDDDEGDGAVMKKQANTNVRRQLLKIHLELKRLALNNLILQ